MTEEKRVQELHRRMAERKRKKESLRTAAAGVCSLLLFAGLFTLIGSTGLTHQGSTAGLYSGATLLFESTGGYVLAAILAFMAGVFVTALLMRRQGKQRKEGENKG